MSKELEVLELIDNANPSEALKGLKHIKKYYVPEPCTATTSKYLEIIEQALTTKSKKELAFDMLLNYIIDYGDSICIDFIVGEYNNIELYNILKGLINNE